MDFHNHYQVQTRPVFPWTVKYAELTQKLHRKALRNILLANDTKLHPCYIFASYYGFA